MEPLSFIGGAALGLGASIFWQKTTQKKNQEQTDTLRVYLEKQQLQLGQLAQNSTALEHLLELAPFGYLIVDEKNQLLFCNQLARDLLGITNWQSGGPKRTFLEYVRSYELDQLIMHTREEESPQKADWNSTWVPASTSQYLRGETVLLPEQCIGVFLQNRKELIDLTRSRDQWTSAVAHELKTPLTSIRLVHEVLSTRISPDLLTWVEKVTKEVNRLAQLVQDLLDLGQWEYLAESPEPIDLKVLIDQAWDILEPLALSRTLRLDYQGPETLPSVGNPSAMIRVWLNLLDNAVKYSPEGKPIFVHAHLEEELNAEQSSPEWLIDIYDQGPGFPAQELDRVFEPFYRADPARARRTGGTGLGLAIVRQIVDAHSGHVQAKNHPETGGAWLQVVLPKA